MKKEEKDLETLWQAKKQRLLMEDEEYRAAVSTYDMKSGADWLIFGFPVAAGIVSVEYIPIRHELLKWCASIAVTVIMFVISVYIKSLSNPHRAISDIEADVKKKYYDKFLKGEKC